MKKIILSTIAASAVLSLGVSQAHADTYTKDTYMPSDATTKAIKVTLPDVMDQSIIDQMKKGTYSVKGVTLGVPYAEVMKNIGVSKDESIMRTEGSSDVSSYFGNFSVSAGSENRYTKPADMIVNSLSFSYDKKNIKYDTIKKLLGKHDSTDIYNDETKDKKDDYLVRTYGMLRASFNRTNGSWTLEYLTMNTPSEDDSSASNAFKDSRIKSISNKEILAMKSGTYAIKGIKPGMKHEDVLSVIGESSDDFISRDGSKIYLSSSYGSEGMISLVYSLDKNNDFILKSITIMPGEDGVKLSRYEKVLGKATKSKVSTYDAEINGIKTKEYQVDKSYGKHLNISADKRGKDWYVNTVTYK